LLEEQGSVKGFETELYCKDGTKLWCSLNARAVYDAGGRLLYYEGTNENITPRKQAEQALQETMQKLRKTLGGMIRAIAMTVETKDPYTAGHQRRVADLARAIAQEMGLPVEKVDGIRIAGVIHDLGKISVPAEILSKPTKLTDIEYGLIQIHPQAGYDILKEVEFPWPIAQIVLQHHERVDGSGYPRGLKGEEILLEARILVVADVVEAMASHRPYRPGLGLDKALEEISSKRGILYDPVVVDASLRLFTEKRFQFKYQDAECFTGPVAEGP
jgi:HD-GYP domain-containing protein (c-di-GMP phosphodiesterase class II)